MRNGVGSGLGSQQWGSPPQREEGGRFRSQWRVSGRGRLLERPGQSRGSPWGPEASSERAGPRVRRGGGPGSECVVPRVLLSSLPPLPPSCFSASRGFPGLYLNSPTHILFCCRVHGFKAVPASASLAGDCHCCFLLFSYF